MNQLPNADLFFLSRKKLVKKSTHQMFAGKDILLIGITGAYVPDDIQVVKDFEAAHDKILAETVIDEIHFVSMNDPYVMDAWWKSMKIKKCKFLADGNGAYSYRIDNQGGMSGGLGVVEMYNKGMGKRGWRWCCLVEDNIQMSYLEEETADGQTDRNNYEEIPYELTTVDKTITWLKERDQTQNIAEQNIHSNDPSKPQ